MFGYDVKQIAEGWAKGITYANQDLHDERIAICRQCPLFTENGPFGPVCDRHKCINLDTGELVSYPGDRIKCGCGCAMDKKTRVTKAKCILGKW